MLPGDWIEKNANFRTKIKCATRSCRRSHNLIIYFHLFMKFNTYGSALRSARTRAHASTLLGHIRPPNGKHGPELDPEPNPEPGPEHGHEPSKQTWRAQKNNYANKNNIAGKASAAISTLQTYELNQEIAATII